MSWLSRVRNGIPFLPKRQSTDNLWHKCVKCGTMVFLKEWEDNLRVCPRCDHHDRIGAWARFEQLFDSARYELLPAPEVREDPLRFKDSKRYTDRLKTARAATALPRSNSATPSASASSPALSASSWLRSAIRRANVTVPAITTPAMTRLIPSSAAAAGRRLAHFSERSPHPAGRATMASPRSQRPRSSATASADG